MKDTDPRYVVPVTATPVDDEDEINLLDYWRILVERRQIVLTTLAMTVAATLLFTLLAVPKYEATATLQIERQAPDILDVKDILAVDPVGYQDFYQTQYKLLQSRSVLRLAAERVDLPNRPEFLERKGTPLGRLYRWARALLAGAREEADPWDRAIQFVERGLSVDPVRNSHLVHVSFLDPNPELAAELANAVVDAYVQFQYGHRNETAQLARETLATQIARLQAQLKAAKEKLQAYSSKKEIIAVAEGEQNIAEQALAELNSRLTAARVRLAEARARYEALRDAPPESLPEVLSSPLIENLKRERAEAERRYAQLAERFGPDWPELAESRRELEQIETRLATEAQAIAEQVRQVARARYEEARNNVAELEREIERQEREVERVNREAIEYDELRTEVQALEEKLATFRARQTDAEALGQIQDPRASNIRIVDRAEVPDQAARPRKLLNLLLAVVFGLGLGVTLAFIAHHVDNTIKTEQDIERYAPGAPVLGHVPLFEPLRVVYGGRSAQERRQAQGTRQQSAEGSKATKTTTAAVAPDLASHTNPRSSFAEAFKSLRTALLLASAEHPPRHIVVTSCEAGDGKSTVALNLAIVLAQMGRRVVLVDADLRRPRLHKLLSANGNEHGLSTYLTGNAELEEILRETEIPGLDFIPSGPIPPNPSELLGSPRIEALLERVDATKRYDHVIFDSPPAIQVADGLILASKVDSTILVVRAGATSRDSLASGVERLRTGRAHLVGVVLNAVPEHSRYYYRYYYRYYRYGDGEHEPRPLVRAWRKVWNGRKRRAG